jgi:hypothetical protein
MEAQAAIRKDKVANYSDLRPCPLTIARVPCSVRLLKNPLLWSGIKNQVSSNLASHQDCFHLMFLYLYINLKRLCSLEQIFYGDLTALLRLRAHDPMAFVGSICYPFLTGKYFLPKNQTNDDSIR